MICRQGGLDSRNYQPGPNMATQQPFLRFSTDDVPVSSRFDCYMDVLQRSLWRVTDWDSLPAEFHINMRAEKLGCLTAVTQDICAHHSHRTRQDIEQSAERSYHIFVSTAQPWAFSHRGRNELLEVGDVVVIGEGEHETYAPRGFGGTIVKCPEHWVKTWLPQPELITGRRICGGSTWGSALSTALRQLTPEFITSAPLPHALMADQVGALLSLLAAADEASAQHESIARIRDLIRQRCAERALTARDIALALNVPVQAVHRALTDGKTTFAFELMGARVQVALPLLEVPGNRCDMEAVARNAGFSSSSHLARAVRRTTGRPLP